MSYVETYRAMIDKLEKFEKIIQSKKDYKFGAGAGMTLDMSGRRLRMGDGAPISYKPSDRGAASSGHPRHIQEFAKLVEFLKRV